MFRRNEKTVDKLIKITGSSCAYLKESKLFIISSKKGLSETQTKQIEKSGLRLMSIMPLQFSINDREYIDSFNLYFKRKSNKAGVVIAVLVFQIILGLIQYLYIASKAVLP